MEIIVQGKGESFYTPDQVKMSLNFFIEETTYETALEKGSTNVLEFIDSILQSNSFNKEDMKTNSFVIKKETKFNEVTKEHDFVGYSYNQSATLKFDYDKEKLSKIMEETSRLSKPPFYQVNFTVKDIKACKRDNLTKAYKDAEEQAQIIAEAAGKSLKHCAKTDFKPLTTDYISHGFGSDGVMSKSGVAGAPRMSTAETINTVFTPEDVAISETLYCLWIAE